jgi:polysaccharide biosynthesis transport protein
MTPESTGQQDVRSYLRILWRWRLLFLACLVVIPAAAYLIERGKPKVYQSSTLFELTGPVTTGSSSAPVVSANPAAIAQLATTTPVAKVAAARLHPPGKPESLIPEVTASADASTGFLTITARDHSPQRAAAIANAFAAALGNEQTAQAKDQADTQINAYLSQLAATSIKDQAGRAALEQQIAQLRGERDASGSGVHVIERAVASATPVGPATKRAVEIAFVIALLLAIGAVVLAENGDLRLRTPEALEHLTNMPLLGVIPPSAFSPDRPTPESDDGAFQMLSAALMFFNVDQPLASVAIISPGPCEGKTTVAAGLAVAAAEAGNRVILLDADLRRPMVCERLGIAETAGLGAVLARQSPLAAVLVEHPVHAPTGGSLRVLPAGPPPPNPAALLASQEMRMLLQELEGQSDLLILDTPAALAVGDTLPLLRAVSGVVMIVRMNRSSRAAVRRLQKVITSARGAVLGVVATGSTPAAGGYGDGYGYYVEGRGDRTRRSLLRRWLRFPRRRRSATSPAAAAASALLVEPRSSATKPANLTPAIRVSAAAAAPPSAARAVEPQPAPNSYAPPAPSTPTAHESRPSPNGAGAPKQQPAGLSPEGRRYFARLAQARQRARNKQTD